MEPSYLFQDSLEKLPGHVNAVFIQIGRVFRESLQQDIKSVNYNKSAIHQVIAKANDQFHEALDDVEVGILKGKAVMERDLEALRAKRAEREKAAGALRLHASTNARMLSPAHTSAELAVQAAATTPDAINPIKMEDIDTISMIGKTVHNTPLALNENMKAAEVTTATSTGLDIEQTQASTKPEPSPKASSTTHSIPQAPTPLGDFDTSALDTQNTAHLSEVDFDTMFADATDPNVNESINFELDFSADGTNMSQQLLNDDPFGDLTTNNGFVGTSDENIDSLMPGIENYVNAPGGGNANDDFSTLGISTTTAHFGSTVTAKTVQDGGVEFGDMAMTEGQTVMDSGGGSTTFDDLFFDDSGDLGMGDEDISGNFGDFDDDWFKSDVQ
ncbi:hypothetical protein MMC19_007485 [Ptychographa xylographoides]|nr:hypothetical protein [Ptychographa xylographoides]